MNLTELASEIERLDAEATPGPWTSERPNPEVDPDYEYRNIFGPDGELIASVDGWRDYQTDRNNSELMVFLRTHAAQIAAALRLLERAKSLLPREAAKAELAVLQWHDDHRALAGGEG